MYSEILFEEILSEKRGRAGQTCFFPNDPHLEGKYFKMPQINYFPFPVRFYFSPIPHLIMDKTEKLLSVRDFSSDVHGAIAPSAFLNKGGWLNKQVRSR
jgi:hypothetical protein